MTAPILDEVRYNYVKLSWTALIGDDTGRDPIQFYSVWWDAGTNQASWT